MVLVPKRERPTLDTIYKKVNKYIMYRSKYGLVRIYYMFLSFFTLGFLMTWL